jgi:hypothetical protein
MKYFSSLHDESPDREWSGSAGGANGVPEVQWFPILLVQRAALTR